MPEYFPALAVDTMPVHQHQPKPLQTSPSGPRSGRLRQTFENDLVLGYLDLALDEEGLDPGVEQCLTVAKRNARRLLTLLGVPFRS